MVDVSMEIRSSRQRAQLPTEPGAVLPLSCSRASAGSGGTTMGPSHKTSKKAPRIPWTMHVRR